MARTPSQIAARTRTPLTDGIDNYNGSSLASSDNSKIPSQPNKPVSLTAPSQKQSQPKTPSTPPYHRGRMIVIIDGTSLFYSVNQLGIEIDYLKFIQQLTQGGQLLRALFYTGVDSSNQRQKGFLHWMRCHGFRVIDKELNHLPDGSKKANLEVEMAIDMMQLAPYCDTVVVVSGNGELAYALDSISRQGVHVEVVSIRPMLSDRLRDVCDYYIDLADIQERIWAHRPVVPLAS